MNAVHHDTSTSTEGSSWVGLGWGSDTVAMQESDIYSASWCWETVPRYSYQGRKRKVALEGRFGEDMEVVHSSLLTYCTSITELDNASQPNQIKAV